MRLNDRPFISVVIPTYNRLGLLKECLLSFNRQTYPIEFYEVLVIDDGSTDGTSEFLSNYVRNARFNLIHLQQKNSGPAAARNAGIQDSKGELIAFCDDDCIVKDDWLAVYSKSFDKDDIGGIGGAVESNVSGLFGHYFDYMGYLSPHVSGGVVYYIITANACYRKDVLKKAGGFNESIKRPGCEDPILSVRIRNMGYNLKYIPEAVVFHYHKDNLRTFARTFYNYGRGKGILDRELKEDSLPKRRRFSVRRFLSEGGGIRQASVFLFLWYLQGVAYRMGCRKGYS
jgi:glycosyltransferase involved in cell wall biosynthesis